MLHPSPELAAGLLLVVACPGGALSNYYCHLGRLNVALSVMMTAISSILAFVSLPLILALIFPLVVHVKETGIPVTELIYRLFLMLLLPIAVGMLLRKKLPGFVERHARVMRIIGMVLVVVLLALIVFDQWQGAVRLFMDAALLAAAFTSFAMAAGWMVALLLRQESGDRYVFSVEYAVRNVGVAAIVAATALGRPEFVIFGALFVVFQFPLIMLLLFVRRMTHPAQGD